MSPRLFGTDGIRGTAGRPPLDAPTLTRVGAALARVLAAGGGAPRLIVGRDTRESGTWIEAALATGTAAGGAALASAGVLPTPGVAYVTRALGFDAGIVVSASHNPFEDNGVKVFSARGEKLSEEQERAVEALVADPAFAPVVRPVPPPEPDDYAGPYLAHLAEALPDPGRLGALRLAIDTANGATSAVAPRLFRGLGFDVEVLHAHPDGRNINLGCGSTHPEALAAAVVAGGHRLGIAFDGDGDRAIFADRAGRIVDGDAVMLFCARHLKQEGRLPGDVVVATVMSNLGLEAGLQEAGITLVRCPVGDKYVKEAMDACGAALGGEQSGHVIFADRQATGDGMLTALEVLRTMADTGRELDELAAGFVAYPQVLVNVRVARKPDLAGVPGVARAMAEVEAALDGHGRLLVRYSGTEPLVRIMIEGKDQQDIQRWADELARRVERDLG